MVKRLNKSGKQLKKIRGKDGRVRAYWIGKKKELHNEGPDRPGFLARHGGKLLAGAALAGGALLARKRLGLGQAGVWKGSVANQTPQSGAKSGPGHSLMARAKDAITGYRQNHGGGLAGHLTSVAGGMALSHLGGRGGQAVGTALGGLLGPGGAAIGGMIGGHAGEWLASRHGSGHVARLAEAVGSRVQGNYVPNKQAVPVSFGGPHRAATPPAINTRALPAPSAANPHAAASHAAHTHPASQPRSFQNPTVSARHAPVSNPINHNDNVTSHFTPRPQAQRQQFGMTAEQHAEQQRRAGIRTKSHSRWSAGAGGFGGSRWGA
jgi:hypothetical protein